VINCRSHSTKCGEKSGEFWRQTKFYSFVGWADCRWNCREFCFTGSIKIRQLTGDSIKVVRSRRQIQTSRSPGSPVKVRQTSTLHIPSQLIQRPRTTKKNSKPCQPALKPPTNSKHKSKKRNQRLKQYKESWTIYSLYWESWKRNSLGIERKLRLWVEKSRKMRMKRSSSSNNIIIRSYTLPSWQVSRSHPVIVWDRKWVDQKTQLRNLPQNSMSGKAAARL